MSKHITNKKEKPAIMKFISDLGSKNYSSARESLNDAIENKLFNKINAQKNINIFKNER